MKFTLVGLVKSLVITLVIGCLLAAALHSFGIVDLRREPESEPEKLVKTATANLEAVRRRQPGERRPASYDSVLVPLDALLNRAQHLLESPSFDPVRDFEAMRSLTLPVIDIATQADRQARSETAFLAKEYRFNAQKGEAIQYLANTMWERILKRTPDGRGSYGQGRSYPPAEMNQLRRLLDEGLEAAPGNADLYYIRGVVNRAEGLFAAAARDLERAVDINGEYIAAWNTLGLVRISLKEFAKAEEALEKARAQSLDEARRLNTEPGDEYVAVIYNLASFHEGLALHYAREHRINPTVESDRLQRRHTAEAKRFFEEFLQHEAPGSDDAKNAAARLRALS